MFNFKPAQLLGIRTPPKKTDVVERQAIVSVVSRRRNIRRMRWFSRQRHQLAERRDYTSSFLRLRRPGRQSPQFWPYALAANVTGKLCRLDRQLPSAALYQRYSDPRVLLRARARATSELIGPRRSLARRNTIIQGSTPNCRVTGYRYNIDKEGLRTISGSHGRIGGKRPILSSSRNETGHCVIDPEGARDHHLPQANLDQAGGLTVTPNGCCLPQDQLYAIGEFATMDGANSNLDLSARRERAG